MSAPGSREAGAEPVFPFVAIDVPASLAEVAAEQLFDLGAEGVEQRDATTLVRGARSGASDQARAPAEADVGAPTVATSPAALDATEVVTLVAAFPTRELAEAACEAFSAEMSPRIEEVVGDAWLDAWKAHFEPFRLSTHVVIRPPWRDVDRSLLDGAAGPTYVLELEPGRAFGTGLHASTALVAQALDDRRGALAGADVLDVGTGSGILSLCALALGAARARAIDVDKDAVAVARENATRNGFERRLVADATPLDKVAGTWPVVLANIQREVLVPLAGELVARVAPGGVLVLSGLLVHQRDDVVRAYAPLALEGAPVSGEWMALVLRAP